MDAKVACRTPSDGRDGATNIPAWKFAVMERAIRSALGPAAMAQTDLVHAVRDHLSDEETASMGSIPWHATCVRLEMEVRGDVLRLPGAPVRLCLKPE